MEIVTGLLAAGVALSGLKGGLLPKDRFFNVPDNAPLSLNVSGGKGAIEDADFAFLKSFGRYGYGVTDAGTRFTGSISVRDSFIFAEMKDYEAKSWVIDFDSTYMSLLDVSITTIALRSEGKEEPICTEMLLGFPFADADGDRDVRYVLNGFEFYRHDLYSEGKLKSEARIALDKIADWSGLTITVKNALSEASTEDPAKCDSAEFQGAVFPAIRIADAISGFDRVIGFGYKHVAVPNLLLAGPTAYLYFLTKMQIAKYNFDHNEKQSIDTRAIGSDGLIIDQSMMGNWRFSLSTMNSSGCEIIATYNLLKDSAEYGTDISLSTLISLFVILNADLLFGSLGSTVLPFDIFPLRIAEIAASLVFAVPHALAIATTMVENFEQFKGKEKDWLFYFEVGVAFVDVLALMAATVASLTEHVFLAAFFGQYSHDVGFIVTLYSNSPCSYSLLDFENCENDFSGRGQGIVTFWNELLVGPIPNPLGQIHTVYVKHEKANDGTSDKYSAYNKRHNVCHSCLLWTLIGKNATTYDEAKARFIASYIY